jgi:hypothetical protein
VLSALVTKDERHTMNVTIQIVNTVLELFDILFRECCAAFKVCRSFHHTLLPL